MRKHAIIVWVLLMAATVWAQQAPDAVPRDSGATAGQTTPPARSPGTPGSLAFLCDEFPGAEACANVRGGRGGRDLPEAGAGVAGGGPGTGIGNGFEIGPGAGIGGVPDAAPGGSGMGDMPGMSSWPGTEFYAPGGAMGERRKGGSPGIEARASDTRAVPGTEFGEAAINGGAMEMGPGAGMGGGAGMGSGMMEFGPGMGGAEPRGFGGLLTDPRLPVETRDRLREAYLRYMDLLIPRQATLEVAQARLSEALQSYPLDRQVVEAHWQAVQAASNAVLKARLDHVAELQGILGEPMWNSLHSGARGLPQQEPPPHVR